MRRAVSIKKRVSEIVGKHRILVIEDQEDLAELYESSLMEAGYDVTVAYTGEEGLAEFEAGGADAILLDMTLPEMHGTKALEKIRGLSPSVPVVVVTGETMAESRDVCERLGVQEYLSKPPDYDALLSAIERSLAQPQRDEQYMVVTLRLPARVLKTLNDIDSNLERAITRVCEDCADELKKLSASARG